MVDYKIHWLKMMSVPESRAVVGRHDGINGGDTMDQLRDAAQRIADRIDELIRGTGPVHETASQILYRSFAGSAASS